MKKFGKWSEQSDTRFRSGDNKEVTLSPQTTLPGASVNVTLPTPASGTTEFIVGRTSTDTLINKTLTSPVISTISNSGTLTLPTSTDTLVGRATTDTLTNKTFDADNNSLSNIDTDDIKAAANIAYTQLANLAAINKVLISNGSFKIEASSIEDTELGALSGISGSAVGTEGVQAITGSKTFTAPEISDGSYVLYNAGAETRWEESGGGANYVGLKAPAAITTDVVWTLPDADGAPSQVLSTNGAGVLQWAAALTSSLANDSILIGDGDGNSAATDTAAQGDVLADDATGLTIKASAVTNAMLAGSITDAKLNTISTAGKVSGTAITSGDITTSGYFRSTSVSDSYFTGNVGIGTTSPLTDLHVGSDSDTDAALILNNNNAFQNAYIQKTGGNLEFGHSSLNGSFSSDPAMVITSGKNVGIGGITGPSGVLSVDTSIQGIAPNSMATQQIDLGNTGSVPSIAFKKTASSGVGAYLLGYNHDTSTSDMTFAVSNQSGPGDFTTLTSAAFKFDRFATNLMTILRNGDVDMPAATSTRRYVTIGDSVIPKGGNSSSDVSALAISSNQQSLVAFEDRSQAANSKSMAIRLFDNKLQVLRAINDANNANTIAMAIQNSNGNVGIGTDSPDALLDVEAPTGEAVIRLKAAVGTQTMDLTTDNLFGVRLETAFNLGLGKTTGDGLVILPSGNVGIGTDSPSSLFRLDVQGKGIRADWGSDGSSSIGGYRSSVVSVSNGGTMVAGVPGGNGAWMVMLTNDSDGDSALVAMDFWSSSITTLRSTLSGITITKSSFSLSFTVTNSTGAAKNIKMQVIGAPLASVTVT